jgi:hypothetical protein
MTLKRREFLKDSATALVGGGRFGYVFNTEAQPASHSRHLDQPRQHNMLIVGQQTVFLSHLPVFKGPTSDDPHRYQVILEAAFTNNPDVPFNKQVMLSKGAVFYQRCYAMINLNGPGETVGYYEDGDGGRLLFSESF